MFANSKRACIFVSTKMVKDMTTQELHKAIKGKLASRTNEELISDAKVARANKADETQRMIFALIMDVLATRISEQNFDILYDEITN
jgi:hypothetical protein